MSRRLRRDKGPVPLSHCGGFQVISRGGDGACATGQGYRHQARQPFCRCVGWQPSLLPVPQSRREPPPRYAAACVRRKQRGLGLANVSALATGQRACPPSHCGGFQVITRGGDGACAAAEGIRLQIKQQMRGFVAAKRFSRFSSLLLRPRKFLYLPAPIYPTIHLPPFMGGDRWWCIWAHVNIKTSREGRLAKIGSNLLADKDLRPKRKA